MIRTRGLGLVVIAVSAALSCGPGESVSSQPPQAPAVSVSAGAGALRDGPLGPIVFSARKDGTQPIDARRRFKTGTRTVYAFFEFRGLGPNDRVTASWFRGTQPLFEQTLKLVDVFNRPPPASGHLWLSIEFQEGATAGSYTLDLSVNDEPSDSASFAVDRD